MATKIKSCTCLHDYQDKKYGLGMRVHNQSKSRVGMEGTAWTCTVCGTKKEN